MSELGNISEGGEGVTNSNLLPISADIALGIQNDFIPQLITSSTMKQDYLDTMSGGPIKSGEPNLMEVLAEVVNDISVEDQRTQQAQTHQVALVSHINDVVNRYYRTDHEYGHVAASFYTQGAIIMYECLKRMAEKKGVALPILDPQTIQEGHNQYLQPEKYPSLAKEREETIEQLLDPNSELLKQYLEDKDYSIDMLGDKIDTVRTITLNKLIKDFPKTEPQLYRALTQSGLLRRTRLVEKISTDKYKKALFKGMLDIRLPFVEALKKDSGSDTQNTDQTTL